MAKQEKIAGKDVAKADTGTRNGTFLAMHCITKKYTEALPMGREEMRLTAPVMHEQATPENDQQSKMSGNLCFRIDDGFRERLRKAAKRARRTPTDFARVAVIDAVEASEKAHAAERLTAPVTEVVA